MKSTKATTKAQQDAKNFEVEVTRAHVFNETRTAFDVIVNGVKIYGLVFIEGKKGDFISFPSQKGKDGEYYAHAWFPTDEASIADIKAKIEAVL